MKKYKNMNKKEKMKKNSTIYSLKCKRKRIRLQTRAAPRAPVQADTPNPKEAKKPNTGPCSENRTKRLSATCSTSPLTQEVPIVVHGTRAKPTNTKKRRPQRAP